MTKWTVEDDAKLYHLMCYVNSSLSKRMTGWVGNKFDDLSLSLFADAGFAGCAQTLRSTSGSHMHIQGKHTRFPLSGGSKRQGCVSHSTPEAEIVAADVTLRTMGLPALSIWETLTGRSPKLLFHDDNQGMIGVVRSGRNPTMRHLERTHGIAITSLHKHFTRENYVLMYEVTSKMAADIHTKGFKNPLSWKRACMLINLLDPGDIVSKELLDMVSPTTNVDTTVRQVFKPKPMMYQIFLIQKFLFYHLKCIRRDFLARNRYNNYPVWILFWSLRRRLISGNVQAVCHYPKIVYEALGY